ncbi:OmpA family protein [Ottowia sp. GY511]|uniref:OmpA family protein n=1 Tax=Ottowia flava TaxID=2675430 RepID=A0ABW4KWU4_9BURK|nr:OmpA family protein [Ottowia sp. GY511]TXK24771.1 OmpA family protein [Ottowia sp. GY511]
MNAAKPVTRLLGLMLLGTVVAGCAPATRVVLLPQEGRQGAVEVRSREASTVLTTPYSEAKVSAQQQLETDQLTPEQVNRRYQQLLAAQPAPEQQLTLYFETGGSHLTAESTNQLADVLARATARPGGEIIVTGHTDSVGTVESNDQLSLQRASAIRDLLVSRGFDRARVDAVGRGERQPVVPTPDNTPEPRNRRAEITIR